MIQLDNKKKPPSGAEGLGGGVGARVMTVIHLGLFCDTLVGLPLFLPKVYARTLVQTGVPFPIILQGTPVVFVAFTVDKINLHSRHFFPPFFWRAF